MTELKPDDFPEFFEAVHGHLPFLWQTRLLRQVAERRAWPPLLDLPTGSGKTAAIDIAVFHLALEATRPAPRRAAMRVAFVVDRRLIVDDAFLRAETLAKCLEEAQCGVVRCVADALRRLAGEGARPLEVARLRGGVPREDDWARTPCQPTVLCSTVDQVGSRLLFRGYGVSPSMAPVHAGLLGSDCLILLDEAHLAQPFRQTAEAIASVACLHGPDPTPLQVALLSATAADATEADFTLHDEDRSNPILAARLGVRKLATLKRIDGHRALHLAAEAQSALITLRDRGIASPVVAVVVNRVKLARDVFEALGRADPDDAWGRTLIIGAARGVNRNDINADLTPVKTGNDRTYERPRLIVATQTIEAGVDLDLDGLVTELAALDALRQRFGRLNRAGRPITPVAAILAHEADLKADDPVYGRALGATWAALGGPGEVDFGIDAFATLLNDKGLVGDAMTPLLAPRPDAPVLMPAYVDLWAQTSPVPTCDPEPALFLHGANRAPDSVRVVWRADIDPRDDREQVIERLSLVPPRAAEAIELPVWTVRAWLAEKPADLADIAMAEAADLPTSRLAAFRWAGPDSPRTRAVLGHQIAPGDTVVVPSGRGGCDRFGWNPAHTGWTDDVYDRAAKPFAGRRCVLRLADGLVRQAAGQGMGEDVETVTRRAMARLADALADLGDSPAADVVARLRRLPAPIPDLLAGFTETPRIRPAFPYRTAEGARVGVVLFGTRDNAPTGKVSASGEEDAVASFRGQRETLASHVAKVRACVRGFAHRAGLPDARAADLDLAAEWHDSGKDDPRFQRLLAGGDPFAVGAELLAKSGEGRSARGAWERVGLPAGWRHEARSVRHALTRLDAANDKALVLYLIGTHHGHGRPFFPHYDLADGAFDLDGLDWAAMFAMLREQYGTWGLARLEAVLRLADHRASELSAEDDDA